MAFKKKSIYKMNKITQMSDGRYRMRIPINGERIAIYGKSEDEVTENAIAKYELSVRQEVEPSKERFDKSLLSYMEMFKIPQWSKSTYSRNMLLFRTHIENKKIGKLKIGQIESRDIQELLNSIASKYSYSEVRRVKFLISPYFKHMLLVKKLNSNPCEGTSLPKEENCAVSTKDMNTIILSTEEMERLLLVSQKYENKENIVSVYYHALLILISSGIRIGELMALKWENIDFKNSLILIENSTNLVNIPNGDGKSKCVRIVKDPKTKAGKRMVGVSDQCRISFEYIREYQERHKIQNIYNLVVCNSNGNYIQNRDLRNVLKRISKEIGINEKATIHGLRHSFGTYIYGKTKDIIGIQRVMGHTDSRTTEKFYVHTPLEMIYNVSNAFDIKTIDENNSKKQTNVPNPF